MIYECNVKMHVQPIYINDFGARVINHSRQIKIIKFYGCSFRFLNHLFQLSEEGEYLPWQLYLLALNCFLLGCIHIVVIVHSWYEL